MIEEIMISKSKGTDQIEKFKFKINLSSLGGGQS